MGEIERALLCTQRQWAFMPIYGSFGNWVGGLASLACLLPMTPISPHNAMPISCVQ